MDAAIPALLDAARSGRPGHLARVAQLSGFGLRDVSEGAVVLGAAVDGRLLGGLADDALRAAAAAGQRLVRASIPDTAAESAGLVCGGLATLVLTPIGELPDELLAWLAQARPVALATPADGTAGALAVTERDHGGTLHAPAVDDEVVAVARELLRRGRSDRSVLEVAGRPVLVSAVVPRTRVLVVGSGAMAGAIEAQARLLDWEVVVTEDGAQASGFAASAGPADAVVVLSHDPDLGPEVLAAALAGGAGYVGAMGSRATQSSRRARLLARGVAEEVLARVHGPVGLDLGARTPAETAVSIVAEVLADRNGRVPQSLRSRPGPISA